MPFQPILPTWLALNAANDTSASGITDLRTGQVVNAGGLNLGDYFDLTEAEANALSYTTNGTLHAGRYRRVLVDSGATAANVKTGTIGLMASLAAMQGDLGGTLPASLNIVTSYDQAQGGAVGLRPVVFLNTVTPGNYCFVQELGVANVLFKTGLTGTATIGGVVGVTTGGVADAPSSATSVLNSSIGQAIDSPLSAKISRILLNYSANVYQG